MPKSVRPLWTCPKCGVKLLTKNLSHSCGLATVAEWRSRMTPAVRVLYDHFERLIANCGEYHVSPAKTRIAFLARVRFSGITAMSADSITCSFALPKPLKSKRFLKVEEIVPGWWAHRFKVNDVSQLDDEVQAWIKESYRLMGMQERLTSSVRRGARRSRSA